MGPLRAVGNPKMLHPKQWLPENSYRGLNIFIEKKINPTSSHENAEYWGYCSAVLLRAHQLTHCTNGETKT